MNWKTLFNPFEKYSEKTLLIFGIVATFLGSFVGFLMKARFDGILDMHIVQNIKWYQPFLDNLINITLLSSFLIFLGKAINRKTRFIDILVTVIICRIPIYLSSLSNIGGFLDQSSRSLLDSVVNNGMTTSHIDMKDLIIVTILGIIVIPFIIWMIVLLWKGFKTATNNKTIKGVLFFIKVVIATELISKLIIKEINF